MVLIEYKTFHGDGIINEGVEKEAKKSSYWLI